MTKQRLLLTRSAAQNQHDRQWIDEGLYQVFAIPLIETRRCHYQQKSAGLAAADWLFFTSSNAVYYFYEGLEDRRQLATKKIAVIGQQTAQAVKDQEGAISFMPSRYTSQAFIEEWQQLYGDEAQAILLPKSDLARSNISAALTEAGHQVEEAIVYENHLPPASAQQLRDIVAREPLDLAFFTSPSAWQRFYEVIPQVPEQLTIGVIGPVTLKAVQASGYQGRLPDNHSYTMKDLLATMLR